MSDMKYNHGISWFQASRRPSVLFFHISIVIPILLIPFFFGWKIFVVILLWAVCDLWLYKRGLTLKGAVKRARLWGRAGYRNITHRREYQKIKRGL